FTIYADDITFSGNSIPQGFKQRVLKVVREEGFRIHPQKGGVFNKSKDQIITGISIAHGPSAGKLKKIWRAERHHNKVKLERGEISRVEYTTSETRFAARMVYATSVRKAALKLAR